MPLTNQQKLDIKETISHSLKNKFSSYNPEPAFMPFHTRLLGKDRLALYSFIHSLNTNFGTSIFEPVAVALASTRIEIAQAQRQSGKYISTEAQRNIQEIIHNLSTGNAKPEKNKELESLKGFAKMAK